MNEEEEFLKRMENLKLPKVEPPANQEAIKMTIMNAERSAALGVWLIVLPCYFLFCVFMYQYSQNVRRAFYGKHLTWVDAMYKMVVGMDKNSSFHFLGPVLLVILPLICIVINALAITHVKVQKIDPHKTKVREFNVSIKIKGWNILLILVSVAIVFIFIIYAITLRSLDVF
jgi:hypothetical protein